MKIEKIGIKFGDNDFHSTFTGVLSIFKEAYIYNSDMNFTKEQILELINRLSYTSYIMFQNEFRYNEEIDGEFHDNGHTDNYLKIESRHLHINEEVDAYINSDDFFNSEYFAIDFTVREEPYIYSR